jgi:hypothetical protein
LVLEKKESNYLASPVRFGNTISKEVTTDGLFEKDILWQQLFNNGHASGSDGKASEDFCRHQEIRR